MVLGQKTCYLKNTKTKSILVKEFNTLLYLTSASESRDSNGVEKYCIIFTLLWKDLDKSDDIFLIFSRK